MIRTGVRLGVDVGSVRVGLARSDPHGILATPVETLRRDLSVTMSDIARIAEYVAEWEVLEIVVGLPTSMSGADGAAAEAVRGYADAVARRVRPVPVRLLDERLSTVTAHDRLRSAGVKGRRHRPVVDQVAAVVILQSALDAERSQGRAVGRLVPVTEVVEDEGNGG